MKSLVSGMSFILQYIQDPIITVCHPIKSVYPYLLISIGSGVSIILVQSKEKYVRLGGSVIGGGTLLGLGNLLIGENDFDKLHVLGSKGNNQNIDIVINSQSEHELISSSLGKVSNEADLELKDIKANYKPEDIASSLLTMISINIGHVSTLYAKLNSVEKYNIN